MLRLLRPKPGHAQTTNESMRGKETLKAFLSNTNYKSDSPEKKKKKQSKSKGWQEGQKELALCPGDKTVAATIGKHD